MKIRFFRNVETSEQKEAIQRLGTLEGIEQMFKWLQSARNGDPRHLCFLLAQCWHVGFC